MEDERDKPLTPEDQQLAELIFEGHSCERISLETGLTKRAVQYIARGDRRSHIRQRVDEMVREFQAQEKERLVRLKSRALDTLAEGLKATRVVCIGDAVREIPDHPTRVRAAMVLRADPAVQGVDPPGVARFVTAEDASRLASKILSEHRAEARLNNGPPLLTANSQPVPTP